MYLGMISLRVGRRNPKIGSRLQGERPQILRGIEMGVAVFCDICEKVYRVACDH